MGLPVTCLMDGALDVLGLVHHLVVHVQAARRVHDHHVAQVVDGVLDALLRDLHRILPVAAVHAHTDLGAERLQLVGRGGAVHVAGHEQGRMVLLLQAVGQLRGGRRLAGALQAHQHDDVGDAAAQDELAVGAAQQLGQLVEHDLDDVLRRRQRVEHLGVEAALLRARDERLHHLEVDVRFQKRHADLAHGVVDIVLGQAALAAQPAEYALQARR